MVRIVKAKEKTKKKPGRPTKLRIEDQILLTLQYLREYRTNFYLVKDGKVCESSTCRIVFKIENILIQYSFCCQFFFERSRHNTE